MPTVTPTPTGFNPLHCGAVVASHNYGWVPGHDYVCFNPLHCGAVVASRRFVAGGDPARSKFQSPSLRGSGRFDRASRARIAGYRVSIPFIAGQWSLRARRDAERRASKMFQSPSLRGSGRFMSSTRSASRTGACFNPLHCGAVVASHFYGFLERSLDTQVSIPFIAGQWSLPTRKEGTYGSELWFQSPSLRGSGRFRAAARPGRRRPRFQSPSLRGSGRFTS